MNHLISTEEIDNYKRTLLDALNHIENNMIDEQIKAKEGNYNYDNTIDLKRTKELRNMIFTLTYLPIAPEPKTITTEVSKIDIMQYKLWGFAECSYKQITGNDITINSIQEYESALQEINKELHLNESN
jgi:hypothetical protein